MIVTSVVPPELPMELSLAVTNSLAALSRSMVFCTEPYRIAFAGKLDCLCFDKTGTLTKDRMLLKGLVLPVENDGKISPEASADSPRTVIMAPVDCSSFVRSIMASCHSLFLSGGKICGDPLECVTVEATGYSLDGENMMSSAVDAVSLKILQRFPFSSSLKRMSVRADSSVMGNIIFSKGAPEVMASLFTSVPGNYVPTYTYHMGKGKRVLALGYRIIDKAESRDLKREDIERSLNFGGFLVFDCDLKPDSKSVMKELIQSNHKVVMITGDSSYTACEVARKVGMLSSPNDSLASSDSKKKSLSLSVDENKCPCWVCFDTNVSQNGASDTLPFDPSPNVLQALCADHNICVSGEALLSLRGTDSYHSTLRSLSQVVSIFARVSPSQKEEILNAMNDSGYTTLMVGDGTNDVGALKSAHVGVSIVNDPDFESRIDTLKTTKQKAAKAGTTAKDRMVL
jgi:cation-transporting ATPase 13A1